MSHQTSRKVSDDYFFPKVHLPIIKAVLKEIESKWDGLLENQKGTRRDEAGLALHRLKEALIKLDYRYFDVKKVTKLFDLLSDDEIGEELHYLQVLYVDRVEAFHQQVYATLSNLILVLNYLPGQKEGASHPINSVEKFLNFVKDSKSKYRSSLLDQIDVLQKSRDFRSKFIDHPQQHQLHDWMTFRTDEGIYLIFFKRKGDEVYMIDPTKNPFDPDFKPPVNCGNDFYISPNEEKTLKGVEILIRQLLEL